jgi:hypothetical protein
MHARATGDAGSDAACALTRRAALARAQGPHGVTPLHLAAHRGRLSVVELLLRESAPINALAEASFGYTPLYMAADMGHTRVVHLLLAANASTELRAHHGGTALHAAVVGGHVSVVKALIDAAADVDARDNEGMRPLLFARGLSESARAGIMQLLMEGGAQPLSAEEEEALRSRSVVRAEVRPFMRMA